MAEVLASLKKIGGGGGKYTETSLWTNSAPTSDFGAQTVTLSDSIDNYKYIKIKYCFSTSYNTGNYLSNYIISVDEFKKAPYPEASGTARLNFSFARMNTSNVAGYRRFYYASSTTVRFGSTDTNALIPLEILGINELKGGSGLKTPFVFVVRCPQSTSYGQSVMLAENYNQYTYMRTMSQAEVNSWWGRTDITVATSVTLSESSGTTTIQETTLTTSPVLISSLNFVDTNMIWAQVRGTACAIMLYD